MTEDKKLPIVVILERLIDDESFRTDFFADPEKTLADEDLTDDQKSLLYGLKEEDIRHLEGQDIGELFVADSAVYMPSDEDVEGESFEYLSDDFDIDDIE